MKFLNAVRRNAATGITDIGAIIDLKLVSGIHGFHCQFKEDISCSLATQPSIQLQVFTPTLYHMRMQPKASKSASEEIRAYDWLIHLLQVI